MSILNDMVVIPQIWFYILIGVAIIGVGALILRVTSDKKFCPERAVLVTARKKKLPIVELVDLGSNSIMWLVGTKEKPSDIMFDFGDEYPGIRIDPVLTTGCEPRRLNGLDIYSYAYESWLPQTTKNHLAFKAIAEYKLNKCNDLDFLTDQEFIALISTPENYLDHDCAMYINKYFKSMIKEDTTTGAKENVNIRQRYVEVEDLNTCQYDENNQPILGTGTYLTQLVEDEITTEEMVNRIESIKNDIARLPISRGYFAATEAFRNNAQGYSAQNLSALLDIYKQQMQLEMQKKINMMVYATAAVFVIIAGAVAFAIIYKMVG